ncbi:unnamed protein product [Urochloa humidicola]
MARSQVVVLAVVAAVLLAAAASEAAVTCGQVNSAIGPCLAYARGQGSGPSAGCCSGVRSLNSAARTTADRRTACNCLKVRRRQDQRPQRCQGRQHPVQVRRQHPLLHQHIHRLLQGGLNDRRISPPSLLHISIYL